MPGIAKASHDKKNYTLDYLVERLENSFSRKDAKAQRKGVFLRVFAPLREYNRGA